MPVLDTPTSSGASLGGPKTSGVLVKNILDQSPLPPPEGSLVNGKVIALEKKAVYVDLEPFGTGIIYGREYINAKDVIKNLNIGDSIKTKVVERENEEGYTELSLEEARQAAVWSEAEKAIRDKTKFELEVKEANKGGLILEWHNIKGFLPASQLKSEHYPRVEEGDKSKILQELKKLVGKKLEVVILSALPDEEKLIFSEKEENREKKQELLTKYSVGDVIEAEVAGIVDFGIFLKLENDLEGLVHISEIDWGFIDDLGKMFKVGEKVKAKIIEIEDDKISLSIKALKENPWKEFEGKLRKGDIIKGVVLKYNPHGALVSIKEGVAGLVHKSSLKTGDLQKKLDLGKTYNFQVTLFEPKEQRLTLAYLEDKSTDNS